MRLANFMTILRNEVCICMCLCAQYYVAKIL
nr:MAG TPA: hypothetical protein [Caudoviricetes sp.]